METEREERMSHVDESAHRKQARRRRDEAFDSFGTVVRELNDLEPRLAELFGRLFAATAELKDGGIEVKATFGRPMQRALQAWVGDTKPAHLEVPAFMREPA